VPLLPRSELYEYYLVYNPIVIWGKVCITPREKCYLRAMAELGPGHHRSGDIAEQLGREVTSLGPTRSQLIFKGMIWSPSHGDTAFTVPLFDGFMRRIMPGDDWRLNK